MTEITVGFAFCGSFCTFDKAIAVLEKVCDKYHNVLPILSETAAATDSRYGAADDFVREIERICGKEIVRTIAGAEPIGPKKLLDILVIAPCTGNTAAKIASGITDSSVTMGGGGGGAGGGGAKAHLRNGRPLLIAVSTNDGLSGNAENIGTLLNRKNVYFVPFYQDDPVKKPNSIVADFDLIPEAIDAALSGQQVQPLLRIKNSE